MRFWYNHCYHFTCFVSLSFGMSVGNRSAYFSTPSCFPNSPLSLSLSSFSIPLDYSPIFLFPLLLPPHFTSPLTFSHPFPLSSSPLQLSSLRFSPSLLPFLSYASNSSALTLSLPPPFPPPSFLPRYNNSNLPAQGRFPCSAACVPLPSSLLSKHPIISAVSRPRKV